MERPRVLIVGGGIAGLALATALQGSEVVVDLVERSPHEVTAGSGLYLPANAVRALHTLGLGAEVMERATRITRQRMLDHRGRTLVDMDVRSIWGGVGACVALSRTDLHEILRQRVAEETSRFGVALTDLGSNGLAIFNDGSTSFYDLVVGADGINSTVRRIALPDVTPRFLGQVCWRFIVDGEPDLTHWTGRLGTNGRTFLTIGLGGGRVYCYAAVNSAEPTPPAGDWRELFADFADPVPRLLQRASDAYFAPLLAIDNPELTRPGLVLIGDAAHACSPSMAQGGAMALEDAAVLGELLGDGAVARALDAFPARRAERIRWVLDQNHRRDRARNLPTLLRALVLRLGGEKMLIANHAPLHATP